MDSLALGEDGVEIEEILTPDSLDPVTKPFGYRKGRRDSDSPFPSPIVDSQGRLIKDEQTVNVFLIAFLSSITATSVPFHTRWVAERNGLFYQLDDSEYNARTDGHLRDKNGNSRCIIEVKPRKRNSDVKIRVQESAQMAAWISQSGVKSHDPMKDCRYSPLTLKCERLELILPSLFHLAQDKDQIYLSFPEFTESWGDHSKGTESLKKQDFLIMHEYGPFSLTSAEDISEVAMFLNSYTLHVASSTARL